MLAHERIVFMHKSGRIDLNAIKRDDAIVQLRGMGIKCSRHSMGAARKILGIKAKPFVDPFVSNDGVNLLYKKVGWL